MSETPLPAPAAARPAAVLAHDYLLVLRGAERVFAQIADMYPGAPVLTLLYDPDATEDRFAGQPGRSTSPLQRLGAAQRFFRRLLPLYPWAVGTAAPAALRAPAEQQQRLHARR